MAVGASVTPWLGRPRCWFCWLLPLCSTFPRGSPPATSSFLDWPPAFNVVASIFVVTVYSHWNVGPPWQWDRGFALPPDQTEAVMMFATWVTLVATITLGVWLANHEESTEMGTLTRLPAALRGRLGGRRIADTADPARTVP